MAGIVKLSSPETREYWEIQVLFEDEHLIALDKPSRLLTSPDRYDPDRPNLMKLLHRDIARKAPWAAQRNLTYLSNAHRLDFETSGVLLLAKDKPTLISLANLFGSERISKTYVTLVQGNPAEETFTVDRKLGPHPIKLGLMRTDAKNGKKARTEFKVIERYRGFALLQCHPLTGRTHQIRVHLQSVRLPIVGDALYGGRPLLLSRLKPTYRLKVDQIERPLINRVALHAAELALLHPSTGTLITITSPWPKDLTVGVKYLRRYGQGQASLVSEQPDQADPNDASGQEEAGP